MLGQLRIQCPSCGIILDVKNSRHEAVKQIVCPNCKKQLAVNFEEELKPVAPLQPIEPIYYGEMRINLNEGVNTIALPNCDKVEIRVVRLRDGNSKCLVRSLHDSIPVLVNGHRLQLKEQVALSKGDYLEIGNTVLRVGESAVVTPKPHTPTEVSTPEPQKPKKEHSYVWLSTAIAFVALMVVTVVLWPSDGANKQLEENKQGAELKDTIKEPPVKEDIKVSAPNDIKDNVKGKDRVKKPVEETTKSSGGLSNMSDFELEKKALGGSVDAQYELGARLLKRGGVNNYIRGIKYLKLAAHNGFSKAQTALPKIVNSLQKRANDGDSVSYYILKEI